jgi:transcriptional regulator with XRE-family HTH domain
MWDTYEIGKGSPMDTVAVRLRWARRLHGYTQRELAKLTGAGLNTIRRIEQEPESFTPQLGTVEKLAAALHVRAGWLAFGEEPMVDLADMTEDEQIAFQTLPDLERRSDFLIGGTGPWYRDGDVWLVEGIKKGTNRK